MQMTITPLGFVAVIAVSLACPRLAGAQADAKTAARLVTRAASVLDSARKTSGVRVAVLDNADVIYEAAVSQESKGNYTGAQRLVDVAIRLAHGAQHGPMEIGARIDSIPFGVVPIGPGVPQTPSAY